MCVCFSGCGTFHRALQHTGATTEQAAKEKSSPARKSERQEVRGCGLHRQPRWGRRRHLLPHSFVGPGKQHEVSTFTHFPRLERGEITPSIVHSPWTSLVTKGCLVRAGFSSTYKCVHVQSSSMLTPTGVRCALAAVASYQLFPEVL